MPKRTDLKKVMIIGSGPIVIGQACEFDYSGTQACKALKEEGYTVILLNSNPATVMTDPELADRTYVEPLTVEFAERIIEREKPDALLPTLGGQTALNLALDLHKAGVLAKHHVQLIGADVKAIEKAEDRKLFKLAMEKIGLACPKSGVAHTFAEAEAIMREVGLPAIIRPSFTMGGTGGGIAYNHEEFEQIAKGGLAASPVHEILVEESVIGWKEFELEVMRDTADNAVIICSIENFDPMGVHTGDSITVAPAQTLTDKEYQRLRDASLAIMREIGVATGGSNVQFAINPVDGRLAVVEMNPRVSRSSALASKATGFPIAKIAAKLAVGYTLDELRNDITRETPASFEPSIDYVVVKIPRFAFEKFPATEKSLSTQMKSVGEVMAIGRSFKEAFHKALRSMENDRYGLESVVRPGGDWRTPATPEEKDRVRKWLRIPGADRLWQLGDAFRCGFTIDELHAQTGIDPWFLRHLEEIIRAETIESMDEAGEWLRTRKQMGFSDRRLGQLTGKGEDAIRALRQKLKLRPVYKRVDTCAAEFEAHTPYLYSTYEQEDEAAPTARQKVLILGSGPNRIGQGIEFDYCCVHAAIALKKAGYETIMVNCNPETVSTDYDTSDRLYFEPLTLEDVLHIAELEKPVGAIVQFGGQTPLKLAVPLARNGVTVLGTSPDAIDMAEDRERFAQVIIKLGLRQPENGVARSEAEAFVVADRIGYPAMVRPSYVLGGRAMEVIYDRAQLATYMKEAVQVSNDKPVLIDRFLKEAVEVDVDLVMDRTGAAVIAGVMEHIEEAGVHSGDAAFSLPPHSLTESIIAELKRQAIAMARELKVVGLCNVQFAIQHREDVYVLEMNPRASRTVPFVAKATGVPIAQIAARCMLGETLAEQGLTQEPRVAGVAVKASVFPFRKFNGVDTILGPEMKSTGEVMGIDDTFGAAFAKSQIAAGNALPACGTVFISVRERDKPEAAELGRRLIALGFELVCTAGTQKYLQERGVASSVVKKVTEGRPHVVDRIIDGQIALVINTTSGRREIVDSFSIRREALMHNVPYMTTIPGARASVAAMESMRTQRLEVKSLQERLGPAR
jgi:carbamoyl-phosphate synthase large subunit